MKEEKNAFPSSLSHNGLYGKVIKVYRVTERK
jgi:hypothetical protein